MSFGELRHQDQDVTEWNVGCEKCHGPGSLHVEHPSRKNIVNPETLDYVRGNDTCIQCHSQGQPLANPIEGVHYDWPVGFLPGHGCRLLEVGITETGNHKLLQYPDLTRTRTACKATISHRATCIIGGLRCFDCHQVHSVANKSNLAMPGNALCLSATPGKPGWPARNRERTHAPRRGQRRQPCAVCHLPKIEQNHQGQLRKRAHLPFITPEDTEQSGIPNPCTSCHKDKSAQWAKDQLKSWTTTSRGAWRSKRARKSRGAAHQPEAAQGRKKIIVKLESVVAVE